MLTLLTFPKASSHFLWSFSRFVAQGKNWRANSALNSASDLRKERDGDSANCWETGSPHTHTHDFPPRTEQGDTMPSICLIILSIEQPALTMPHHKTAYFARKCSFSPPLIVPPSPCYPLSPIAAAAAQSAILIQLIGVQTI